MKRALKIGVTGHLSLDAHERARVSHSVNVELPQLLGALQGGRVEILSGLAPGADLVLTDAVIRVLAARGIPWSLHALLIGEPEDIIFQWLERAQSLGDTPSRAAQDRVRKAMSRLLEQTQKTDYLRADQERTVFQQLALRLAQESDVLVAVLRPAHPGRPGGTAEVLQWRESILESQMTGNDSRATLIIDPEAIEGGAQRLQVGGRRAAVVARG